mgnify:CR=1 FL=1
MKKISFKSLLAAILFLTQIQGYSQTTCEHINYQKELEGAKISAAHSIGNIWFDSEFEKTFVYPKDRGIQVMRNGSFWLAGKKEDEEILATAQFFDQYFPIAKSKWRPGPESTVESCENWNQHFSISSTDINRFEQDLADGSIDLPIPSSVLGWPGNANPHFESIHGFNMPSRNYGFAPFEDNNNDGIYDPKKGDIPLTNGASMTNWWLMNDFSSPTHLQPLEVELQVTARSFNGSNVSLNNSIIYEVKIINRSDTKTNGVAFSILIGLDFGCDTDDFFGSSPEEDLVFIYNGDALDETDLSQCTEENSFGEEIPILGIKQLKGFSGPDGEALGLNSFIYFNRGVSNPPGNSLSPQNAQQKYNYMSGLWTDGSPIIADGEETKFMFAGNPANEEAPTLCRDALPFDDRRLLINFGHFDLESGAQNTVSFSVTGVEDVPYPCPDISPLINRTAEVQEYWENSIINSVTKVSNNGYHTLKIQPNPASTNTTLIVEDGQKIKSVTVYNLNLQVINSKSGNNMSTMDLDLGLLDAGLYLINIETVDGYFYSEKLVKS